MQEILFEANRLYVNGIITRFNYEIKEFLVLGNIVVVRLSVKGREDDTNNIYGISENKIIWRVQDMLEYKEGYSNFAPDPYTGIRIFEKDESIIVGNTSYGFRMLIDPQTGKIVGTDGWTK